MTFQMEFPYYEEFIRSQKRFSIGKEQGQDACLYFTLDPKVLSNFEKLDEIIEHVKNNIHRYMNYYKVVIENKFEEYFQYKKALMDSDDRVTCNGPLSNGDYAIDYYDYVRILIYPNLYQIKEEIFVMDFICIPKEPRHKLKNQYTLLEKISSKFPFIDYFYDDITIESSLSYTSCLRFSLNQDILKDFKKLDAIIDYVKDNIHDIMYFYEELESSTFEENPLDNPMKETMAKLRDMLY